MDGNIFSQSVCSLNCVLSNVRKGIISEIKFYHRVSCTQKENMDISLVSKKVRAMKSIALFFAPPCP